MNPDIGRDVPPPLPTNLAAEQQVLGALLSGKASLADLSCVMQDRFFADPVHEKLFREIRERAQAGYPENLLYTDATTGNLTPDVEQALEEVGGTRYLHELVADYRGKPEGALAGMARRVRDAWIRRTIIETGDLLMHVATQASMAAFEGGEGAQAASMFAWAIDAARNTLPVAPSVSTVIGLHDPDADGKLPDHVVALTASEIEHLHGWHAHVAHQTRVRSGQKQAPDYARAHTYHAERAMLFERLLPMDEAEVAQATDGLRDPADVRAGCETVDGKAVVMQPPADRSTDLPL